MPRAESSDSVDCSEVFTEKRQDVEVSLPPSSGRPSTQDDDPHQSSDSGSGHDNIESGEDVPLWPNIG